MANIVISGDTSGAVTLAAPAVSGTTTLTLPTTSGTVLTTASTTGVNASAITTGMLDQAYGGTGTTIGYNGFKNRIINGAMVIDQRNAGASVTINSSAGAYSLDRWYSRGVNSAGVFTLQQVSDSPTGFKNSLKATVTTTASSPSSTDFYGIQQRIEGYNIADLGYGTASSQPVTVSFYVKSSVTGTFSVALSNNNDQTIPVTFVVNSANTWEQKSITVAGTSAGTWDSTNGQGILVQFTLGAGASRTGTANTWSTSFFVNATGSTNLMATSGATFYITGVQLEKGSTATSFDYRPYGTELALCQRYYQMVNNFIGLGTGANVINGMITAPIIMRTTPSLGITGAYSVSDYFSTDHTQSSGAVSLFNGTPTGAAISLTNFTGITSTRTYLSRFLNSNQITMSAEL